jgi:hypothetical protein
MILLQVENYKELGSNPGFWDNYVWPMAVTLSIALCTGVWLLVKDKIRNLKGKNAAKVSLLFTIDRSGKISLSDDRHFASKIKLSRELIRKNQTEKVSVQIRPSYSVRKMDKYEKQEWELKLIEKSISLRSKIEILLMRAFDIELEENIETIKVVIQNMIIYPSSNVTGMVKLDIYRNYDPKIYFPIHVTQQEFERLATSQGKSVEAFKNELCIPTLHSISILDFDLIYRLLVPSLVREIYRIRTHHSFDLQAKHWENVFLYEIGLG